MKNTNSHSRIQPALAARAFQCLSAEQVIERAAGLGAKGIEWSQSQVPIGQTCPVINAREATLDRGLSIVGYAAHWQGDRGRFTDVVNTATLLGAPTIRLGGRALAVHTQQNRAGVWRSLDVALAAGITLSISYLPTSLDTTLRLMREIAHPSLRLCWRARFGWQEADEGSPLHGLRFSVPNVPLGELIQSDGIRASESVVRARVLGGAKGPLRYTVFDAAPYGASIHRASKAGARP